MRTYLRRLPWLTAILLLLSAPGYAGDDKLARGPVYDIAHFDVIPAVQGGVDFQQVAYAALFAYRDASRSDPGLKSFRVVNWLLASNHSQIIDVWSSLEAFQRHLAQDHSVKFRFAVQVQPPPPPPGFNCCIGSPIDDRQYSLVKSFNTPWISARLPTTVGAAGALFVVTYVDFLQELLEKDPDKAQDKLIRYGALTSEAKGQLSYAILQQLARPNRFAILEVWHSEADYAAWQNSRQTKRFVARTTPLLGSPFDHRLNILCGETFVDGSGCTPP